MTTPEPQVLIDYRAGFTAGQADHVAADPSHHPLQTSSQGYTVGYRDGWYNPSPAHGHTADTFCREWLRHL